MKSQLVLLVSCLFILATQSLLITGCASAKPDAKQNTGTLSTTSNTSSELASTPAPPPVPAKPKYDVDGVDDDGRDSTGIQRARYYGEGLDVLLGRSIKWCIENGWAILNDGRGANGTVVASNDLRAVQRIVASADKGQVAEYPVADCGRNEKGAIIADASTLTIRVKTIGYGKTKVVLNFVPDAPKNVPKPTCKTNGKLEQILLNYLLAP